MINLRSVVFAAATLLIIISFQNCGKVSFSPTSSLVANSTTPDPGGSSNNPPNNNPPSNSPPTTTCTGDVPCVGGSGGGSGSGGPTGGSGGGSSGGSGSSGGGTDGGSGGVECTLTSGQHLDIDGDLLHAVSDHDVKKKFCVSKKDCDDIGKRLKKTHCQLPGSISDDKDKTAPNDHGEKEGFEGDDDDHDSCTVSKDPCVSKHHGGDDDDDNSQGDENNQDKDVDGCLKKLGL